VCVSGGCGMVAIGGVPVFVASRYQATDNKECGWPMAALKISLRLTRLVSRVKERDRDRLSL